jgi:hypothetical protein
LGYKKLGNPDTAAKTAAGLDSGYSLPTIIIERYGVMLGLDGGSGGES